MRILKFNGSNKFQEMKSIIDDVNNILVELKDEGISMVIEPSNDIRVKMASIQDDHFYINFEGLGSIVNSSFTNFRNKIYPLIFEKIHMLIEYLDTKGFDTIIIARSHFSSSPSIFTIDELERRFGRIIYGHRLSFLRLKFTHKDKEVYESLPRQQSVDQLKRIMKLSAKTDIGNRISDMNKQGANIQYIQNPIDSGIESYEDYEKHNKKFVPSWNLKHLLGPFEHGEKKIKKK